MEKSRSEKRNFTPVAGLRQAASRAALVKSTGHCGGADACGTMHPIVIFGH
jgi:hypothetical protein